MPLWNPDCHTSGYDDTATAEAVRLVCGSCADLAGCLQAPADAMYQWLDQIRLRVFRKVDKAADRMVVRVLEAAFALRDKLGASGPAYPGMGSAPEPVGADSDATATPDTLEDMGKPPDACHVYNACIKGEATDSTDPETAETPALAGMAVSLVPVDIDQGHVFLFDERALPFHRAMNDWYGGALAGLLGSSTVHDAIADRERKEAQARADNSVLFTLYESSEPE